MMGRDRFSVKRKKENSFNNNYNFDRVKNLWQNEKGINFNMYKELVICSLLVISIVLLNGLTQNYTKRKTNELSEELKDLKQKIEIGDNLEEKKKFMDNIYSKWKEFHDISAIYIEHHELEKVENNMISCKNFIEQDIKDMSLNELDKIVFGLEHINDKYEFNLINIF